MRRLARATLHEPPESLAVVVPARNEAAGIGSMLESQLASLEQLGVPFELAIVDDASSDGTEQVARTTAEGRAEIRIHRHVQNTGIAGAVLTGVRLTTSPRIIVAPVDNPLATETLRSFLVASQSADIVCGWRAARVDYTPFRRWLSSLYASITRAALGIPVRDPTWISLYRRWIFDNLQLQFTQITGLPEILAHAALRGARFVEVPCPAQRRISGHATGTRLSVMLRTGSDTLRLAVKTARTVRLSSPTEDIAARKDRAS